MPELAILTLPFWSGATFSVSVPPVAVSVPLFTTAALMTPLPVSNPALVTAEPRNPPPVNVTVPLFCQSCSTFSVPALAIVTLPLCTRAKLKSSVPLLTNVVPVRVSLAVSIVVPLPF